MDDHGKVLMASSKRIATLVKSSLRRDCFYTRKRLLFLNHCWKKDDQVLSVYRCGVVLDAFQLFGEMSVEDEQHLLLDVVCWNSVISGCVQNRWDEETFCLFKDLQIYSRYSSSDNLGEYVLTPPIHSRVYCHPTTA
ncbi:hypothetical protein NE237_017089 [Protea cynaroides]|uniref:Uncharacterized protein n=1 Tax=Protea cynaroides TaxID=273540 RepID=A0A9Q0K7D8_9MAGN|nr:hypothetical protein NE237_017089 [Protea cynaroides]